MKTKIISPFHICASKWLNRKQIWHNVCQFMPTIEIIELCHIFTRKTKFLIRKRDIFFHIYYTVSQPETLMSHVYLLLHSFCFLLITNTNLVQKMYSIYVLVVQLCLWQCRYINLLSRTHLTIRISMNWRLVFVESHIKIYCS